jgi:hypothetical protein
MDSAIYIGRSFGLSFGSIANRCWRKSIMTHVFYGTKLLGPCQPSDPDKGHEAAGDLINDSLGIAALVLVVHSA